MITPKTILVVGGAAVGAWMGFKLLKANIEANYHAKMVQEMGPSAAVRRTPKRSDSFRRAKTTTDVEQKPLPLDEELVTPLRRTNSLKR